MLLLIGFLIIIVYAYLSNNDNNSILSNNNRINNNKTYTTDTNNTNNYCVYLHTVPNGKRYVGITKHGDYPNRRWNNGKGYEKNRYFYNDIVSYGWNNITHEILHNGISEREARQLEHYYIMKYRSTNRYYGYNIKN